MSENIASGDDFKPYSGPVYGAYPIPAVFNSLGSPERLTPMDLVLEGEAVVEQIVGFAIDKPTAVSSSPRMDNRVPLFTPREVLVTRSSWDRKIRRHPEVSREITDRIEFEGLNDDGGTFDRIRVTAHSVEYRGGKDLDRESEIQSWYIYFYKPDETQPTAEVYRSRDFSDSYIEVIEEKKKHYWSLPSDPVDLASFRALSTALTASR